MLRKREWENNIEKESKLNRLNYNELYKVKCRIQQTEIIIKKKENKIQ